jgi:hypothetical protein
MILRHPAARRRPRPRPTPPAPNQPALIPPVRNRRRSYYGYYANVAKYGLANLDILASQEAHDAFVKRFRCYNFGSTPEVKVTSADGKTELTKWRTLGRVSHESGE